MLGALMLTHTILNNPLAYTVPRGYFPNIHDKQARDESAHLVIVVLPMEEWLLSEYHAR